MTTLQEMTLTALLVTQYHMQHVGAEVFDCLNCNGRVYLNVHGRCDSCGSNAVTHAKISMAASAAGA